MSIAMSVAYQVEMRCKQKEIETRAKYTAERFYSNYLEQFNQMVQSGYNKLIPNELKELKRQLDSIQQNLTRNPLRAREACNQTGLYINQLPRLAKSVKEEIKANEWLRKEELKRATKESQNLFLNTYYNLINTIKDPVVMECAKETLTEFKQRLLLKECTSMQDAHNYLSTLELEFKTIIENSKGRVAEYKAEQAELAQKASIIEQVEMLKADAQLKQLEDKDKQKALLEQLELLKQKAGSTDVSVTDMQQEVSRVLDEMDNAIITEDIRRNVVKSIIHQLESQEFSVGVPVKIVQNGTDFVKIVAKKPSGKQAECRIGMDGRIIYKFDKYEATTCLKDIERFNVDLKNIYSINLSDERVLWENPDRLLKGELSLQNTEKRSL